MVRPFRLPFVFATALGVLFVASYGCGGDEPLTAAEDAGNDSGLTGGGRRTTSSSSSGDTETSSSSSSSSSSGGSSSGGSSSGGSSSSGEPCDDHPDVPDYATGPQELPDIGDDYDSLTTINGILTPGDEDTYKIAVSDNSFAKVVPVLSTTTLGVELCMYIACQDDGDTVSVDCGDATAKNIDDKIQGCCGASMSFGYSGCSFFGTGNDSIEAYFQIKNTGTQPADQCKEYSIDYQF